ncbi:MAG TPA: EAL domain-containing protein [Actinomycetota bacterium]|nr:EAL domain-containing protein [Actinomycetota bacterium]
MDKHAEHAEQPGLDPHAIETGFFAPSDASVPDASARLADLEARYRLLIDHLPAVLYIDSVGDDDAMIDVSPGIDDLLGVTRETWLRGALGWSDYVHPDDRDRAVAESEACVASGEPFHCEYRAVHADGHVVWVREDAVLIRDAEGGPLYWLGFMLDMTELVETQRDLHHLQSTYGALVEQIPAIVYQDATDENWTTVYVSPQITNLLGVTPEEWIGDSKLWSQMMHDEDRDRAIEEVERGIASGAPYTVEYRMIGRDGRVKWFQDTAVMIPDADGNPAFTHGVMLDISERREAEERLTYLAYHDNLTGMPNRAMFDELLELSLARARRGDRGVAVLALDIDNFKLINDSLGHETGDRLISLVSLRLQDATRDTDLVARPGGDEFLMLLADLDQVSPVNDENGAAISAQAVANRVLQAFEAPFEVDGTELYVTASIGISVFPLDAADATSLMRNADSAVYLAKAAGPGGYVLNHLENEGALSKLSLSTRLRKAVEQQDWTLHYQPLIDLFSGDMFGVEALIRWPDPSGGLVPPGDFIPLAEEMGLIEAIGSWVVEEICRQDEIWRREGLELEIGFNLSPRQLWQPDPVRRIADQIEAAGIDPQRITVEITESTAMHDPDRTLEVLHGFKDHGLKLAIDDFGTGYSSLSRLRYMPVDVLKIDRTFVRDVNSDRQSASMVSAIIALASNLQMDPLAEGIETEEEWRFLAARGCRFGQGYLFSRPVPAEEILAMHRRAGLTIVDGGLAV